MVGNTSSGTLRFALTTVVRDVGSIINGSTVCDKSFRKVPPPAPPPADESAFLRGGWYREGESNLDWRCNVSIMPFTDLIGFVWWIEIFRGMRSPRRAPALNSSIDAVMVFDLINGGIGREAAISLGWRFPLELLGDDIAE